MHRLLRLYLSIPLLVAIAFGLAYWLFPAPPRVVRIAAGIEQGAYTEAARHYRDILARDHITLQVITTSGSIENVQRLRAARDGVDVGFVQGGTAPSGSTGLESLASVFLEPLWVFTRADVPVDRLAELRGRRLAVGAEGSGTKVLAVELLAANGITDHALMPSLGGVEAVRALLDRSVDAAFFVTARPLPLLEPLIHAPGVRLLNLKGAEAYARRYRHLTTVLLPAGTLDLAAWIPATDVTLVATAASLVVRDSLHGAIVDVLMGAATETHAPGGLFAEAGAFPSMRYVELPLSASAQRYFRSGPPFLRRNLPIWLASLVERALIVLLPVAALVIPLVRLLPEILASRFHRRIHRGYARLRALENEAQDGSDAGERTALRERLAQLEAEVARLKIPPAHAEGLYQLRTHIGFIRRRLDDSPEGERPTG